MGMTAVSESIMREKLKVGSKSNTRTPFAFSTLTIFFQVDVTFSQLSYAGVAKSLSFENWGIPPFELSSENNRSSHCLLKGRYDTNRCFDHKYCDVTSQGRT